MGVESMRAYSAIVLAGGKSERMGKPKALLRFSGEPLIVHVVRRLEGLFDEIIVVAAPDQELPPLSATVIRDEVAHQGPVGGIYYGLRASGGTASFVTSCDTPFLNPSLVAFLMTRIVDCDVVVPFWQGRLQPLHAAYRRSVLRLLEEQLQQHRLRPVFLYEKVRTCEIGEEEIRRVDPTGASFTNMNTPADYQTALAAWEASVPGDAQQAPCYVELFGVARLRARTSGVSITLHGPTALREVFTALGEKLPDLVGPVLTVGKDALVHGHACNINGREFVTDMNFIVQPGDRILILSSDAGG